MSTLNIIGKRYAKALFEAAHEKGLTEQVQAELSTLTEVYEQDKVFRDFLLNPSLDESVKVDALKKVFEGKLSPLLMNTLLLLVHKSRESIIPAMAEAFKQIAYEALGQAQAVVYSAKALSASEESAVAERFSALTGKKIIVETVVDPSLLGGLTVRIGDRLYDGSISGKLKQIQNILAEKAL